MRTALLAAVIHNFSGNAKKAADMDTYLIKWLGEERSEKTALAAVKSWAKANNMQAEKGK